MGLKLPKLNPMEIRHKKRLSASVALVLLSPTLPAMLSGCGGNRDCDNNRSTPQTNDDCGRGGRAGGYYRGGGGSFGGGAASGVAAPRSGGFGGFGRSFGGGGT